MARKTGKTRRTRKVLARRVKFADARSYQKLWPNPGVSAIASVNGRRGYRSRYAATRRLLGRYRQNDASAVADIRAEYKRQVASHHQADVARQGTALYAASHHYSTADLKKAGIKPLKGQGDLEKVATLERSRSAPKKEATVAKPKTTRKKAAKTTRKKSPAKPRVTRKRKAPAAVAAPAPAAKPTAAERGAAKKAANELARAKVAKKCARTARKKELAELRVVRAKKRVALLRSRQGRAWKHWNRPAKYYGGKKFRVPRIRLGTVKSMDTFVTLTKSGSVKKVPLWALCGFRSKRHMNQTMQVATGPKRESMSEKQWAKAKKMWATALKRKDSIEARRKREGARIAERGGILTPNLRGGRKRTRALTYAEWETRMKRNASRRHGRRRGRRMLSNFSRKQRAASLRNLAKARAKLRGRKRTRRAAPHRRAITRRRSMRRNPVITQAAANPRRRHGRKRYSTNRRGKPIGYSRGRRVFGYKSKAMGYVGKKHRVYPYRNPGITQAAANGRRRRRGHRRPSFLSFRRNSVFTGYGTKLKTAFLAGLSGVGGYIVHRTLTKLLSEGVLGPQMLKVESLKSMEPYKDLIAGGLVTLIGIPLAMSYSPGNKPIVAAGMVISLFQAIAKTISDKIGDPPGKYSKYLAGMGGGMGSYYEFHPGQIYTGQGMRGMGEYIQAGQSGFGAFTQAAAGMGSAQLTQSAAGVGEYFASNLQGIGDYEEVMPEYTRPANVDEGIMPDLTSAEHELSVAEAAAGIGGGLGQFKSLPAQSSIIPNEPWADVHSQPGPARRGSFSGKGGIFG